MARTEPDKNLTELLGMIRRDFTPKPPTLELQLTQDQPEKKVCERCGAEYVKSTAPYFAANSLCSRECWDEDLAASQDDDRESTENLPGH